jgi:hypothetical protein
LGKPVRLVSFKPDRRIFCEPARSASSVQRSASVRSEQKVSIQKGMLQRIAASVLEGLFQLALQVPALRVFAHGYKQALLGGASA